MADYTKKRFSDINLSELRAGDVITQAQACKIGWATLRNYGLECDDVPLWHVAPSSRVWTLQPFGTINQRAHDAAMVSR